MASNAYGALPTTTVNRVASIEKKRTKVTVSRPQVVSMYNRFIGEWIGLTKILTASGFRSEVKNGGSHCLHLVSMLLAKVHGKHINWYKRNNGTKGSSQYCASLSGNVQKTAF